MTAGWKTISTLIERRYKGAATKTAVTDSRYQFNE
jgi:hypothetical protein